MKKSPSLDGMTAADEVAFRARSKEQIPRFKGLIARFAKIHGPAHRRRMKEVTKMVTARNKASSRR